MKIRILFIIGLVVFNSEELMGQSVASQVLDAYFTTLTRHHQVNKEVSAALEGISPGLQRDYQQVLEASGQDAVLPWAYFKRNLERAGASEKLRALCREGRQLNILLQRYHNYQLVDAFSQSVIDTSRGMRRLQFFGVREGDQVAEIGFGYGYNLHLLAVAFEELEIFANELGLHHIKRMEEVVREEYPSGRRDNFHFVAGAPGSTKLEGNGLDLIIMENVLHHIEEQADFIQSMEESLGPEGEIVIIEEFLGSTVPGRGHCPDLMTREKLERLFVEQGFFVSKVLALEDQFKTMLRLSRKQEGPLHE